MGIRMAPDSFKMIGTPENERVTLEPRDRKVAAEVALASNLVPPHAPSELEKYQETFRVDMEQVFVEFVRQFPDATIIQTQTGIGIISIVASAALLENIHSITHLKEIPKGSTMIRNPLYGGKILATLDLDPEEIPASLSTNQLYGRGLA